MAALILLTGPPGAGKSTVAAVLARRFDPSVLVGGDAFYGFIANGAITPWTDAAGHQNEVCTAAAGAACGRFVAGGFTVVFDGMVGPWLLPQFLAATGLAELDYAVLLPSEEVAVARVRDRLGHGFRDESATRHMHGEFRRSAPDPRHVITDNITDSITDSITDNITDNTTGGGGPEQTAAMVVARLAAGTLRYRAV